MFVGPGTASVLLPIIGLFLFCFLTNTIARVSDNFYFFSVFVFIVLLTEDILCDVVNIFC
jgi:hypothetical protein